MTICTAKVLAHQTLRCPVCQNQKDVSPTYSGYSVRFDCCKSWMVSGAFEKSDNFMVMPAIKLTWAEIRQPVRQPYCSNNPDFESWTVEHVRDRHDHEATGWVIVNEYGEEIRGGGFWSNRKNAERQLELMIAEEIEAREQHGPDCE